MDLTAQRPIKSQYNAKTTASEIVRFLDLRGKNAIVTGGYSGVGLETTRALARAGVAVIVPVHNMNKARAALKGIPNVETARLDLMDPSSIDGFAAQFIASGRPLHILINNAGIMAPPLRRDSRGYESQFSTNHLGHFQLTARLWPALKQAGSARVINVSSRAQRLGGINFDDPNYESTEYDGMKAYAQSKSANVLFTVELDRLARNYFVRAFAVHPGLIPTTNISSSGLGEDASPLLKALTRILPKIMRGLHVTELINVSKQLKSHHVGDEFKTIHQGAATSVWCAVSNELSSMGGVYCEDCNIAEAVPADSTAPYGVRPWAIDPGCAQRLWQLSEKLTGVKFQF